MPYPCSVSGCSRVSTPYSPLCYTHIRHKRRHGHPQQVALRPHNLKPNMDRLAGWIDGHPNGPAIWQALQANLTSLQSEASAETRRYDAGCSMSLDTLGAARSIMAVVEQADHRKAVLTVMAMVLMQEEDPHVFRSDAAFNMQMARMWRRLTSTHTARYFDRYSGKLKTTHRDVRPQELSCLGSWLAQAIGLAALQIKHRWDWETHQKEGLAGSLRGLLVSDGAQPMSHHV